jgi:hypothetical protein
MRGGFWQMANIREFINEFSATPKGKIALGVITLISVVLFWRVFAGGSSWERQAAANAGRWTFICTETKKTFELKTDENTPNPAPSPYSGKNTGVYAEACYWTADGKVKDEPTWVLLNERIGKPGPTFCPDCGRLVTEMNPSPMYQHEAPPTKQEYETSRKPRR